MSYLRFGVISRKGRKSMTYVSSQSQLQNRWHSKDNDKDIALIRKTPKIHPVSSQLKSNLALVFDELGKPGYIKREQPS